MLSWPSGVLVAPAQLYDLVWSKPMRELAAEAGLSDVGLAKYFRNLGIPLPPRGYWAKKAAGRAPDPPAPPERGPGEWGRISVSGWLADRFRDAAPPELSPAGPFASARVPEDLEELRARTLRTFGKINVPRLETRTHGIVAALLRKDSEIAEEAGPYEYLSRRPVYASPFERRRLRILNALLLALQAQGYRAYARGHEQLDLTVTVGAYGIGIGLDAVEGRPDRSRWGDRAEPPPASARLSLEASGPFEKASWADAAELSLEKQLPAIAAGIVVLGEASFRRGVAHRIEVREQQRKWAEERRREEEARKERERVAVLEESAGLLRKAEEVRSLVGAVLAAHESGRYGTDRTRLERWREWALAHADRLDPLATGKIFASFPES